jgi:hypothetical protein
MSANQIISIDNSSVPAVTAALPVVSSPVPAMESDYGQSTVATTSDINEVAHRTGSNGSREVTRPVRSTLASLRIMA